MALSWTHPPNCLSLNVKLSLKLRFVCVHTRGMAYIVGRSVPENFLNLVRIKISKGLSAQLTMIKIWYDKCRHLILNHGGLITQNWVIGCGVFTLHFVH